MWILAFILGGIRGRIHGGFLGIKRQYVYPVAGALNATWIWYLGVPWYYAIGIACAVELFWAPGHQWTSFKSLILRYGPLGLYWWYAQKWWPNKPNGQPVTFDIKWIPGVEIDGPIAVAEILARATMYGIIIPLVCGLF